MKTSVPHRNLNCRTPTESVDSGCSIHVHHGIEDASPAEENGDGHVITLQKWQEDGVAEWIAAEPMTKKAEARAINKGV